MQVDLKDKPCLVVGGGGIGLHKTRHLIASGASVRVVSSSFHKEFDALAVESAMLRKFEDADIQGMFLVHAATSAPQVNHHIGELCAKQGIWCCVADDTSKGSFGLPAILDIGALRVAVSTNGLSPAYGARLRREIAEIVPDYIDEFLAYLGNARERSKQSIPDLQLRMRFNAYLASDEGQFLFESSDTKTAEARVVELLAKPETIPELFTPKWG